MTISSTTRIAGPFTGTGVATTFPFSFKVFQASDLYVVKLTVSTGLETVLTVNTDYTVTLNGNQDSNPGGNVILPAVLASGYTLTITSDIANLQPTNLTNQGGFYPEVITDALDRACIQIQQLASLNTRSLVAPISDGLGTSLALPAADLRANKYLAFDANGVPMAADGTDTPNITSAGNMTITANNAGSNVARDVIFYDNATETMRILGSGSTSKVGIGISAPASRLHVHESGATNCNVNLTNGTSGSTATDGLLLRMDTVGQAFVYNMENAPLLFGTNATEKMQISAGGNVGINTTIPAGRVGIDGDVYLGNQLSSGTSGTMRLVSSAGLNYIQSGTSSAATSAPFVISAIGGGAEWMRVTNSSVTIGASGTASDLTVYTTATSTINANAGATICNSGNTRQINLGVDDTNSTTWIQGWIPGTGASNITLQPNSGNVGVGTTSPGSTLDVNGGQIRVRAAGSYSEANANCGALYYDTTGGTFTMDARSIAGSTAISFRTSSSGTGAERMKVLNSGAVGITQLAGTGNRAVYSDPSGYLTNTSSDGTLKTNVVTVTDGASIVAALRPVRFDWIDQQTRGAQREVGLIAQEVQTVLPEVVGINNDGTLTVDYSHIVSVLIGAVQTLQAKVAALEANA